MPQALFLHGAGAWGGQWAIWGRVFMAAGWTVAAPDLVPTAAVVADARFDARSADATAAFEALPPDPARIVVGASLGGLLALAVAARATVPPTALVLLNPLPPSPWARRLPPFDADGDVVPWRSAGRFAGTVRALPGSDFDDRRLAFDGWRDEGAGLLREAHAGVVLPRPRGPVLVIASGEDKEVPPDVSEAFALGIGAAFRRVPGGHLEPVMGRGAAGVAAVALGWLASVRLSAG